MTDALGVARAVMAAAAGRSYDAVPVRLVEDVEYQNMPLPPLPPN